MCRKFSRSGEKRVRGERQKGKKRECGRQVELWEIQQTLGRGEYVEGILSLGGGQATLICAPVSLTRGNGSLDWRA